MRLPEWYKKNQKYIDEFQGFWRQGMADEPDAFPQELREVDWDEQFEFFKSRDDDLGAKHSIKRVKS